MEGHSSVDQALVTGEPISVGRDIGDSVIGGSMNGTGTMLVRVAAIGEGSFLQRVAREVEAASEHPLAWAIVTAAFERDITPPEVEQFEAIPGKGVGAEVGGETVPAGGPRLLAESDVELGTLTGRIAALEGLGRTVIVVARGGQPVGLLALADTVRPEAAGAIAARKQAGVRTVLITGDNEGNARRVAAGLGIDQIHAGLLPGEKAELVLGLQRNGRVAMVGDGINDAPALMQADVGIAMGGGTDIAVDSADIIIRSNRLDGAGTAREISRHAYRKMVRNVSLAFLFNGIGVPLAATGPLYPVWAMVAMAVSVTTIFFNSLWGRPSLFFQAILSFGKPVEQRL